MSPNAAPNEPQINLTPEMMFCPEHLEPFRAEWPRGYPVAMVYLFEVAVADERIIEASGGRAEAIEAALREFGPPCCMVDPGELSRIYCEAGIEAAA